MKPYLVDVPVVLYVFVRPDTLKRVFDVVTKARPSILFLVSDGPRESVPTDKQNIEASRKVVEDIDWDCKVYRFYYYTNCGMYAILKSSLDYVFSHVDRCVFLEDDVVPSVSFFQFCAELLEKYKYDLRVNRICGMNHTGFYSEPSSDYFFSQSGSSWGFAIWKRTYEDFDYQFTYGNDKYIFNRLKENASNRMYRRIEMYAKGENVDGHAAGAEFYFGLMLVLQNRINIVATKNMICNIGFTEGSTHAPSSFKQLPKGLQKVFNMQTHEYKFPLKHPAYVIEDKNYEKIVNKIMGVGYPTILFYRRIEFAVRQLIYGDKKKYAKGILKKIFERNQVES